ncbi:hypothetical protein NJBCHELONAE_13330 [Mycobacteroides chelonae]|nr:hypothetical protein NJBCHELONAE_13330 [Mycobacteroides chelonae]
MNRVSAAIAVMTAVITQPWNRSVGPKSAGGIRGPGDSVPSELRDVSPVGGKVAGTVTRSIVREGPARACWCGGLERERRGDLVLRDGELAAGGDTAGGARGCLAPIA